MPDPSQTPKLLIVRPSALGDVCRTAPVLASLRHAWPEATIDWVVQEEFAPAIAAHPALTEAITFPRNRFASCWRSPRRSRELADWFRSLRRRRYDIVLDCQGLGRSGLITWATAAPRRVGLRKAREFAWLAYNLRAPVRSALDEGDDNQPRHTVDEMLSLVEAIGCEPVRDMRLYCDAADRQWWNAQRDTGGFAEAPYAVLAPTSRWESKRWPAERFAGLVQPLRERGFERVVIMGTAREREQVRPLLERGVGCQGSGVRDEGPPIAERSAIGDPAPAGSPDTSHLAPDTFSSPVVDLTGRTSVGQTLAVIAEAGLVVANDSAPLHMAVGFDRPCVGLFGPTDPATVGPYRREASVVRGYRPRSSESLNFKDPKLGDSLMRLISIEVVVARIDAVLNEATQPERAITAAW